MYIYIYIYLYISIYMCVYIQKSPPQGLRAHHQATPPPRQGPRPKGFVLDDAFRLSFFCMMCRDHALGNLYYLLHATCYVSRFASSASGVIRCVFCTRHHVMYVMWWVACGMYQVFGVFSHMYYVFGVVCCIMSCVLFVYA